MSEIKDTIEVDRERFFKDESSDPKETVVVSISYRGKDYKSTRSISRAAVILGGYNVVVEQASQGAIRCIKEALVNENLITKDE